MKPLSLVSVILALAACTSEVVVMEPTAETRAAACALAPGANVCARSFAAEGAAGENVVLVRATVQDIVTFAGLADSAKRGVAQECSAILVALAEPQVVGDAACLAAATALRRLRASGALGQLEIDRTTCREELPAVPECSSLANRPPVVTRCPVRVPWTDGRDASALEAALASLLARQSAFDAASALATSISGGIQTLGTLRAECVPEITTLASAAITSLGDAVTSLGQVRSALDDS